jgi:hypothetical protein
MGDDNRGRAGTVLSFGVGIKDEQGTDDESNNDDDEQHWIDHVNTFCVLHPFLFSWVEGYSLKYALV